MEIYTGEDYYFAVGGVNFSPQTKLIFDPALPGDDAYEQEVGFDLHIIGSSLMPNLLGVHFLPATH